jgi:hypothetical protein
MFFCLFVLLDLGIKVGNLLKLVDSFLRCGDQIFHSTKAAQKRPNILKLDAWNINKYLQWHNHLADTG